jgi:hypothetical protein
MSSFKAIGVNLLIGGSIASMSLVAFGIAVRCGANSFIAPRTWARPKEVLRNALQTANTSWCSWPYAFAWIPWALNLTYQEMLQGIPGTGTRTGGKSGNFLATNLDGIILLRMHALCLKVAILATFVCVVIILPLNMTSVCNAEALGSDTDYFIATCQPLWNLTDFENTTLAHIPSLKELDKNLYGNVFNSQLGRLYGIVLCTWIIYIYTCVLLWREWQDALALRRVFYLEHNHWKERQDELEFLEQLPPDDNAASQTEQRPPWLAHPEVREIVPNISLWSVLFRLPKNTPEQVRAQAAADADNNNKMHDWQLQFTTQTFDDCIPNQPGFSSSVAAVTILPDPSKLSVAWGKWYSASAKLRRLQLIRSMRRRKQRQANNGNEEEEEVDFILRPIPEEENNKTLEESKREERAEAASASASAPTSDDDIPQVFYSAVQEMDMDMDAPSSTKHQKPAPRPLSLTIDHDLLHTGDERVNFNTPQFSFIYRDFEKSKLGYSKMLGLSEHSQFETILADFGVEQTAVYAREFAQR